MCTTLLYAGSESELTLTSAPPTVKPDPPTNVSVWQVEGQETRMKITWNVPSSWKPHRYYYRLIFELKYRPVTSSVHYWQVSNLEWGGDDWLIGWSFHSFSTFRAFALQCTFLFFFGLFVLENNQTLRQQEYKWIFTVGVACVYGCRCWD